MIRDRRRIANKLERVQNYILNCPELYLSLGGAVKYAAAEEVDRLRCAAKFDPQWKWEGFVSELAWAKAVTAS